MSDGERRVTAWVAVGGAAHWATALLAALLCARSARAAAPPVAIAPDARVQTIIDRAAHATSEADLTAQVQALAALAAPHRAALAPQLVYYAMQQHETRAAMVPAVLRERLGLTGVELTEGLLPYLATPDPTLRAQLYNWLGAVDAAQKSTRDFSAYRTIIDARRDAPPLELVRYMYDTDADAAVVVLAEIYAPPAERQASAAARRPVTAAWAAQRRGGSVAAAQHASARAALQTLSADPAWWVRLYAATAVAQMPDLATPELLARLRGDPHPLVRRTVSEGS